MGELKYGKFEPADASDLMEGEFQAKALEMLGKNTESLDNLERCAQVLISNVSRLEEEVPHDDVLLDNTTQSYHVLRNAWLARLAELSDIKKELSNDREVLEDLAQDASN